MKRILWVTTGLVVMAGAGVLNAGRTGFIPVLYAWPAIVILATLPGFVYVVYVRRRRREESLLQGEVAWRRNLEFRALTGGKTEVAVKLQHQSSKPGNAKQLGDAEELMR